VFVVEIKEAIDACTLRHEYGRYMGGRKVAEDRDPKTILHKIPVVAERMGIHRVTLYRGLEQGTIRLRTIRIGRSIRVSEADLVAFIASQTREAVAQ
jgi:excisionase family DNA binding protein